MVLEQGDDHSALAADFKGEGGVHMGEVVEDPTQAPHTTLLVVLRPHQALFDVDAVVIEADLRHQLCQSEAEVVVGHQQTPPLNLVHPSLSLIFRSWSC